MLCCIVVRARRGASVSVRGEGEGEGEEGACLPPAIRSYPQCLGICYVRSRPQDAPSDIPALPAHTPSRLMS